jgi:hypothetical protein
MRRLLFVICAVFAAASVVSFSTLAAHAQSEDQYGPADGAEKSQGATENTAPEETSSGASSSPEDPISQGSVVDSDSPEAVAAQEGLAEEESLPDYSQVVDNTTKGVFRAPGWKVERGSLSHEGSFVSVEGAKAPARFELKIPTTNDYSVYAWWPKASGSGTARYGVQAVSGTKWSKVEQRADSSGMWVKIGSFAMEEGQRSVQIAAKPVDGRRVFADAVAVVRGEAAPPEDDQTMTAAGARTIDSKSLERFSGRDVVRQARRHIGDRYRYGTCTNTVKSCTCLTKEAVQPFGHRMGMAELGQWRYDGSRKVARSALRPGDEVFFKEGRSNYITHVGIYSGNGRIVHASSYWGKVVEKEMKYIDGYFGAKRFKSR